MAAVGIVDMPQPAEILALLTRIDGKLGDGPAEFQRDVGAQCDVVARRFDAVDRRLAAMDVRVDRVDKRFAAKDVRVDRLERRVDGLDRHLTRKIDGLGVELVDHMDRLHLELVLRVEDLEGRPLHGTGGGEAPAG